MSLSTAALIFPEKLFPSPTWFPPHYSLGKQMNLVPRWQMTSWMSSLCFVASCGQASLPKSLHCHLQQHPFSGRRGHSRSMEKFPKFTSVWVCKCGFVSPCAPCSTPFISWGFQTPILIPKLIPVQLLSSVGSWQHRNFVVLRLKRHGIWNKSSHSQSQHVIYSLRGSCFRHCSTGRV